MVIIMIVLSCHHRNAFKEFLEEEDGDVLEIYEDDFSPATRLSMIQAGPGGGVQIG